MKIHCLTCLAIVAAPHLSGCCTPQPARLDPKRVAAYLDAVATVVSFAEENAPAEQKAEAAARFEPVNEAGRKLLSR